MKGNSLPDEAPFIGAQVRARVDRFGEQARARVARRIGAPADSHGSVDIHTPVISLKIEKNELPRR
jgi:hypothetical protein